MKAEVDGQTSADTLRPTTIHDVEMQQRSYVLESLEDHSNENDREGSVLKQVIEMTSVYGTIESTIPEHRMNLSSNINKTSSEVINDIDLVCKDVGKVNSKEQWTAQVEKRPKTSVKIDAVDPTTNLPTETAKHVELRDHLTKGQSITISEPVMTVTVCVEKVPGKTTTLQGTREEVLQQFKRILDDAESAPTMMTGALRQQLGEEELEDLLVTEDGDEDKEVLEDKICVDGRLVEGPEDFIPVESREEQEVSVFIYTGSTKEMMKRENWLKFIFNYLASKQDLEAFTKEQIKDIELTLMKERAGVG